MARRGRRAASMVKHFGRMSETVDDPSRPISDLLEETNEETRARLAAQATPPPMTPPPAPVAPSMKETPMSTPSTALATTSSLKTMEQLASSQQVPEQIKESIDQAEWDLMTTAHRVAAIEFLLAEMKTTTEGLPITFPVVRYPTSGSSFWEVPTAAGEPEALKLLEGVVVFKQMVRVYYPFGQAVAKQPPTCASLDMVRPSTDIAEPQDGGKGCAACRWAQWGSARNQDGTPSRGQACKQRLRVFLLRPNEEIPTLLSLPPSSLKTFGQYALQLRQSKASLVAVTTVFGLADATSNNGTPFKSITLKVGRRLRYEEMKQAAEIRAAFEQQMARRGIHVDEGAGGEAPDETPPANGAQVLDQGGRVVA